MENNKIENPEEAYEKKKRAFFTNFALKHLSVFRLHKEFGLLPKTEGWANVSRHCLVEAVAMDVMAKEFELSDEDKNNLIHAALLHDFYKRKEIELFKEKGDSVENVIKAEKESEEALIGRDISPRVVVLTSSIGVAAIDKMKRPDTTLEEKMMFYIDNITENDNIVNLKDKINALPARYPEIAQTGIYATLL
ncbi:MAG TPA: hypothetical protein VK675_00405, partial [Candidatus Paceibacterota bacterium]|nr:hypothetical protein [Candidatus Paceibacterota bacterium]